jgi:hypothetical protein
MVPVTLYVQNPIRVFENCFFGMLGRVYIDTFTLTRLRRHRPPAGVPISARLPPGITVFLVARKSRLLELLAFDEKSTLGIFCFISTYVASLALNAEKKQKNQK